MCRCFQKLHKQFHNYRYLKKSIRGQTSAWILGARHVISTYYSLVSSSSFFSVHRQSRQCNTAAYSTRSHFNITPNTQLKQMKHWFKRVIYSWHLQCSTSLIWLLEFSSTVALTDWGRFSVLLRSLLCQNNVRHKHVHKVNESQECQHYKEVN